MPIEYVVLNQGAVVLELWSGIVSHDELLAHEQRHLSDSSIARCICSCRCHPYIVGDNAGGDSRPDRSLLATPRQVASGEMRRPSQCGGLRSGATIRKASNRSWRTSNLVQHSWNRLYMVGVDLPRVLEELKKLQACSAFVGA